MINITTAPNHPPYPPPDPIDHHDPHMDCLDHLNAPTLHSTPHPRLCYLVLVTIFLALSYINLSFATSNTYNLRCNFATTDHLKPPISVSLHPLRDHRSPKTTSMLSNIYRPQPTISMSVSIFFFFFFFRFYGLKSKIFVH